MILRMSHLTKNKVISPLSLISFALFPRPPAPRYVHINNKQWAHNGIMHNRRFHQLGNTLTLENLLTTDLKDMAPDTMEALKKVREGLGGGLSCALWKVRTLGLLSDVIHAPSSFLTAKYRLMTYIKMMVQVMNSLTRLFNLLLSLML